MFHGHREERREERANFGHGGAAVHYKMRQRLASIGNDYDIENDQGVRAFHIDGKALRIRQTLIFQDAQGRELCKVQERIMRVKDTMDIEGPNGETLATVKKALVTPLRERWVVRIGTSPAIDVQGNILDHEYTMEAGGQKVAEISKRWFRVADTYGVEIAPGQNDVLVLAATAAIDIMAHPQR